MNLAVDTCGSLKTMATVGKVSDLRFARSLDL
jgi:hypothetical protein